MLCLFIYDLEGQKLNVSTDRANMKFDQHPKINDTTYSPSDDEGIPPGSPQRPAYAEAFADIVERRFASRRSFLKRTAAVAAAAPLFSVAPSLFVSRANASPTLQTTLTFSPISPSTADELIVPEGYRSQLLIGWGESLIQGVPNLDTNDLGILLTHEGVRRQEHQFGYNCDFTAFFPFPTSSMRTSIRGLLAVNHEFTTSALMFPGWPGDKNPSRAQFVQDHPPVVGLGKAAHGVSIVEIRQSNGTWTFVKGSPFNRRVTGSTPVLITGPAAGHALLRTASDPQGRQVLGTLNNCAGGKTPWGTLLTCEENFDQYFGNYESFVARAETRGGDSMKKYAAFHRRIPLSKGLSRCAWELVDERFDADKHPTEAFRFGWVVEVDPYDPGAQPKKRTALGRFKHECATTVVAPRGNVVVYSGDDTRFEYVYKFVTDSIYDPTDRRANRDLLDSGTLYVAKFNDDGSGEWLPLVYGQNGLDKAHGFENQAEVLINARAAGDRLGATPMDRPEDIAINPTNGKIYIAFTNNTQRTGTQSTAQGRDVSADIDAANPRRQNNTGHIIEIIEAGNDPTATTFQWEIFMLCGDPKAGRLLASLDDAEVGNHDTYFAGFTDINAISPISAPDNLAFDQHGNLWIATDGKKETSLGFNNGLYAVPTQGSDRGHLRQFLSGPRGSEVCGPEFTPDFQTLFACIQHPGEGGSLRKPISDWPDRDGRAPRPSVVVVYKNGGKSKGSRHN